MLSANERYLSLLGSLSPSADVAGDPSDLETRETSLASEVLANRLRREMRSNPVVLCAEPGMNAEAVVAQIVSIESAGTTKIRVDDYGGMGPEATIKLLGDAVRWCRSARATCETLVVCLHLSCGDEADMETELRLVRKMASLGAMIVVVGLPDIEPFAEAYGEATRYWSCDLQTSVVLGQAHGERVLSGYGELTHDIPLLVDAVERMSAAAWDAPLTDPHYQEAYCMVAEGALREGLINEELRLRCAMFLLGHGTFDELCEMCGQVDDALWRTLPRDAPFFGVDVLGGAFDCACSHVSDSMSVMYPILLERMECWPELAQRAARLLVGRGDLSRAALVAMLCSDDEMRCEMGVEHASEFVNAGEVGVVVDALSQRPQPLPVGYDGARCLLWAAQGTHMGRWPDTPIDSAVAVGVRRAQLACWCRDLASGADIGVRDEPASAEAIPIGGEPAPAEGDAPTRADGAAEVGEDLFAEALLAHGRVVRLMAQGRLEEAYLVALDAPGRSWEGTVVGSLLLSDYVFCALVTGTRLGSQEQLSFDAGGEFLRRAGLKTLCALHEAAIPLAGVLMGRCVHEAMLEALAQRAARNGATLLQGIFMLGCAVGDLRGGALARGHVRLGRARTLFESMGIAYWAKVSSLLDIALQAALGSCPARREIRACRSGVESLDAVVELVYASCYPEHRDAMQGMSRWSTRGCPKDVLWLANVLSRDCADLSKRFGDLMPRGWRDALGRALRGVEDIFWGHPRGQAEEPSQASGMGDRPYQNAMTEGAGQAIEVMLLGGFETRIKGRLLSGRQLERRRAKSMLTLLSCVPGHVAKRFTIMESIWPEYDYQSAKKCLYSATSVLRAELCLDEEKDKAPSVIVCNKAEGTVAIDSEYLICDVDMFEDRAHRVMDSEGDDRHIVALCREIEELYKGDLCIPATDGMGIVARRAKELRELYADVMIAGADAATRLGMKMLACRFARRAHVSDSMREDAVRALVTAFCAAGRQLEAQRCYESYASKVIDVTRRPPSRRLRKVVEDLVRNPDHTELGQRARLRQSGRKAAVEIVRSHAAMPAGQLALDLGGV